VAALALLASCGGGGGGGGGSAIGVDVLSSDPAWVSGGDALVKVSGTPTGAAADYRARVNGTPVAATFVADPADGKPVALVSGLPNGQSEVTVELMAGGVALARASRTVTNHPRNGPMFSGPRETPFACQTDTFRLYPGGPFLPASTAPECTVPTRVDYIYRTAAGAWAALPSTTAVPADAATTTTSDGRSVRYIVRLETGVVNRSIYQTAVLHNPVGATEPSATNDANGWNGRLVYTFGGGCTGGWYRQGNSTGGVLDDPILRQGYAMASSSLNVYGNNCQDVTPAESMAMVKERFIEAYGPPRYTIGWGCSGGSYQQHQIADNYPGLLDGILPGCSFPEVLFGTVYSITDMRLLGNYFTFTAPGTFDDEQQRLVAGVQRVDTIYTDTVYNGAMRIAPNEFVGLNSTTRTLGGTRTFCPAQVPPAQRWSPTNTTGVRCNVYDHAVNQLGRDPATGYARRPIDNVGVQYGLAALNAGAISVDQFLDLNAGVGGYDVNANFQPARTVADLTAVRNAYETGRLTNGGGGLKDVPIIDYRAYADDQPGGDIHLRYHSFSMRERLVKANGDAGNHVMLHEDFRFGYYSSSSPLLLRALAEMDKWIAAIQADTAGGAQHAKVVRNKPATLVEGCNNRDPVPTFIAETQSRTSGQCAALYPVPPAPRVSSGASIAADVIKCTLKPVTAADYTPAFTTAQMTRLNAIFPTGVCNWAVPGVEQRGLRGTWLSF
jgi:hypothetical protein